MVRQLIILALTISTLQAQNFIADHTVAKEDVLRTIPASYITWAKENFHIVYQHTSHGTHVSKGLFGLPDYKSGDDTLFAITSSGTPENGKLDFMDCYVAPSNKRLSNYAASGDDASDLSRNETAFIQATRNMLDDESNANINIVMWSWCDIAGHDVSNNYLPGMDSLIAEYGPGGTNPRASVTPVTFIFMTGHGNAGNNVGDGKPKNQADLIINHCKENSYYCLDYFNIDAHDMDGNYWEDAGDNGQSSDYGGNFYEDWQANNTLGENWYENKDRPGGSASEGDHNTQHITANRKAYAMWWILARLAGMEDSSPISGYNANNFNNKDNIIIRGNKIFLNKNIKANGTLSIFNMQGKTISQIKLNRNNPVINLSSVSLAKGVNLLKFNIDNKIYIKSFLLN